jgi:hypothetical protein
MRALPTILCVGGAAIISGPAVACYEPSAPYCATTYGAFSDEYEFSRCRREMESYQSDVEIFVSCQKSEIEDLTSKANRAISDHSDAVESFNRRARQ